MMIIGLTGGLASGKTTVAAWLKKANIPVVDADDLSRELSQKNGEIFQRIIEAFGPEYVSENGELDRLRLASAVFNDRSLLHKLEAIMHPAIRALAKKRLKEIEDQGHDVAVYVAPLIFEKNLSADFDKTLVVIAKPEHMLSRAVARDQGRADELKKRIDAQLSNEEKISRADFVITNDEGLDQLYLELKNVWPMLTGQSWPALDKGP